MVNQALPPDATMTGAWVLDLSRSDTFEGHLRFLGNPEATLQSQVAAERAYRSRNVIALDDSRLVIYKDTAVNHYTEMFELDEERVTPCRSGDGVNHITASLGDGARLDGYVIVSITSTNCGRQTLETIEARQLIDGGSAHVQHLNVRKIATGEQYTTRRTWVRVAMTENDRMRLLC